jgi:hypothetical protein
MKADEVQKAVLDSTDTLCTDIESVIAIFQQSPDIVGTGCAPDQDDLQQPNGTVDPCWQCPICGKVLQHKDSFRGHIRKLVHSSTRPKCHLNPSDDTHKLMVARFAGGNFYEKAQAFCKELNSQVKWSCTKRDDAYCFIAAALRCGYA